MKYRPVIGIPSTLSCSMRPAGEPRAGSRGHEEGTALEQKLGAPVRLPPPPPPAWASSTAACESAPCACTGLLRSAPGAPPVAGRHGVPSHGVSVHSNAVVSTPVVPPQRWRERSHARCLCGRAGGTVAAGWAGCRGRRFLEEWEAVMRCHAVELQVEGHAAFLLSSASGPRQQIRRPRRAR
jgi:hypothetical protein